MGSAFVQFDANGLMIDAAATKADRIAASTLAAPSVSAARSILISGKPDVTVPGSLSGTEAYDLIGVDLVAGQMYSFTYRGTARGGIDDPYLALFDPSLSTVLAEDDDGGFGRGSMITFTATTSGTHYLYATSFATLDTGDPSLDTGNYTIDIWSPDPNRDAPATFARAERIAPGTSYGFLNSGTDIDTYRIEAKAGQFYTFTYAGGIAGSAELDAPAPGENIGVLDLYDAAGNLLASGANYETGIDYLAQSAGPLYLKVSAFDPALTGGYTLDVAEIDPADYDPLDAIDWRDAANVPFVKVKGIATAYVYFGAAGENFGETGDDGKPMITHGWQQFQIDGVMNALREYEKILGVKYVITTDVAKATFRLATTESDQYGAYFYPRDPAYGAQQGIGVFNLLSGGFTLPASLEQGGYSYGVVLHEFGHAHGLAHPHDNGGGSDVMLGVTGSDSLGIYDLNQGVYTVMSYNDGWATNPDGAQPFTRATTGYGWSGSLSAFDIAQLQERYGEHVLNKGNTLYQLDDANAAGTFFQTIWDTGGNDTIRYDGARDAHIDLLAATLDYTPTGGGVVSYAEGIYGGYTIANGVVIENAEGGSGDDVLIGNEAKNLLLGHLGADVLIGRGGRDILRGGADEDKLLGGDGIDMLIGGRENDTFVFAQDKSADTFSGMSIDFIGDFQRGDLIDLSAFDANLKLAGDQAFTLAGKSTLLPGIGQISVTSLGSLAAAERTLGVDLRDFRNDAGRNLVSLLLGENDGDATPDFAILILGANSFGARDFYL